MIWSKLCKGSPNDCWQTPLRQSTVVLISTLATLVSRVVCSLISILASLVNRVISSVSLTSKRVRLKREKLRTTNRVLQPVHLQGHHFQHWKGFYHNRNNSDPTRRPCNPSLTTGSRGGRMTPELADWLRTILDRQAPSPFHLILARTSPLTLHALEWTASYDVWAGHFVRLCWVVISQMSERSLESSSDKKNCSAF